MLIILSVNGRARTTTLATCHTTGQPLLAGHCKSDPCYPGQADLWPCTLKLFFLSYSCTSLKVSCCTSDLHCSWVSEGNRVCTHGPRKLSGSEVVPTTPSRSGVSLLEVSRLATYCTKWSGSRALQGKVERASESGNSQVPEGCALSWPGVVTAELMCCPHVVMS